MRIDVELEDGGVAMHSLFAELLEQGVFVDVYGRHPGLFYGIWRSRWYEGELVCPRGVASAGNQEPQIERIDPDFFDNEPTVPNGRSRPVSG